MQLSLMNNCEFFNPEFLGLSQRPVMESGRIVLADAAPAPLNKPQRAAAYLDG